MQLTNTQCPFCGNVKGVPIVSGIWVAWCRECSFDSPGWGEWTDIGIFQWPNGPKGFLVVDAGEPV